jgi:cell wall-associated NlpC family hydrolase
MTTRADIVRVARSYIGTPYHHLGRTPHVRLDCAGVLVALCRELGIYPPDFDIPPYSPNPDGALIPVMDKYMGQRIIDVSQLRAGDAVVVRYRQHPQHIGIIGDYPAAGQLSIIHSNNDNNPPKVVESRLVFSDKMRFVCGYKFKGIE